MFGKKSKTSNIIGTAKGIIYNKYVLYVVFLAALFDLLYSAVKEDYTYCILFVLVGFLVAFFNKNMTVILTLTIAISTILRNLMRGTGVNVEGFDEEPDLVSLSAEKASGKGSDKVEGSTVDKDKKKVTTPPSKPDTNNALATESPKKTQAALMTSLKDQALDLQEAQQKIIKGFEKIEPYMDKAESLIGSIQETATTIQGMRSQQGFKNKLS